MHLKYLQLTISAASEKRFIIALTLLWLALHVALYFIHGVRTTGDTKQYLNYAAHILENGELANNYYLKYAGYPIFLSILFKLGFSLKGVIICQTLLSGVATVYFYKATRKLAGNPIAPILATFILIAWYDLQLLHAFIMTESLYISLLMMGFYLLVRAKNVSQSGWALLALIGVALVRPNGFIAVVAYLGYLIVLAYQKATTKKAKATLLALVVIVPLAAVLVVDQYLLTGFLIVETYEKGELIYMYRDWLVHPDKPIVMPPVDASPLTKMYLFVRDNTSYFVRMSAWRFLLFWGNFKPFFSTAHNLGIAVVLYPMYVFTAIVMLRNRIPASVRVFVALVLLQQAFITTVTSEDWMGRFLMSVVAFVFMFGSIGLSWQLEKWQEKYKPAPKAAVPAAP